MKQVLVLFTVNEKSLACAKDFSGEVILPKEHIDKANEIGLDKVTPLEDMLLSGSSADAVEMAEEISLMKYSSGERISESFKYGDFSLWWIHYNGVFLEFTLPYVRYKKLLEHVCTYDEVTFYGVPHVQLFKAYIESHGKVLKDLAPTRGYLARMLPFGVVIQILLTALSLVVLFFRKKRVMIFTGDKFKAGCDYDFRLAMIYEELRRRNIPFVEIIRSLESWKKVLKNALYRKRPVIYSSFYFFIGRMLSVISRGHAKTIVELQKKIGEYSDNPIEQFKMRIATHYLTEADIDRWGIRISKWTLKIAGVHSGYVTSALDRNYYTVLGCQLLGIQTVGIMHGLPPKEYNPYDFATHYPKHIRFSVDKYGMWSTWWKAYYEKHSSIYESDQLIVSGLMRPYTSDDVDVSRKEIKDGEKPKVLFISEQLAIPEESIPYLDALNEDESIELYIKFRPSRDLFELWLQENRPELLKKVSKARILRGDMQEAIASCDVVTGSHSTAVAEAAVFNTPFVFYFTDKWKDYFKLSEQDRDHPFFAQSPEVFHDKLGQAVKCDDSLILKMREQFFGDPTQNGASWVVDELEVGLKQHSK